MPAWRLILDGPRGAAENMAVDEAILRSCAEGCVPPTVRVYSWDRPSISIGCMQPAAPDILDLDYCRQEGIEVVRRITGGRAVVHGSDVTFSLAIREIDLPEGCANVIASHRWLMGGVVTGLRRLGIDADIGPERSDATDASTDCFARVAECDVRVGRTKVVGSAQVRRFGALMEQGSTPYAPPGFNTARVFGQAVRAAAGSPLYGFSHSSIAGALIHGFRELANPELEPAPLTRHEAETAAELAREVYSTLEWTTCRSNPPSKQFDMQPHTCPK